MARRFAAEGLLSSVFVCEAKLLLIPFFSAAAFCLAVRGLLGFCSSKSLWSDSSLPSSYDATG